MQPAMKEPIAAMPRRGPGAATARHLVAVERGHHRGRFARDVDQDRRGRGRRIARRNRCRRA